MKHGYLLLVVTACGFQTSGRGEPDAGEAETGVAGTWRFDTAADFGAPGRTVEDMRIEARGSLAPHAYTYGGLVAHGREGMKLWTRDDTAWTKLDGITPSGAGLWRGERLDSTSRYEYFGITNKTMMTIWFEGEVWLEQSSTQTFSLGGNDISFVELARPGTTAYELVLKSGSNRSVAVPQTGWYPIRIGFADGDNSCNFEFLHSDTGGTPTLWTRDRLRARTGELRGALRTVFDRQVLGGGVGGDSPISHFELSPMVTESDFDPLPQGASKADDWSARYVGQLYVDQPGMYSLRLSSDDGHRVRLGSAREERSWGLDQGTGNATSTTQAMLAAGWNDLVIDYNQVSQQRNLSVRLTGGGLDNVEVPRDALRPVESADDRLVCGIDEADRTVPDASQQSPGTITSEIQVPGFTGETVAAIDVQYEMTSQRWNDLEVELERPGLAPVVIRPQGTNLSNGLHTVTQSITNAAGMYGTLLGGPAGGTWRFHVSDNVPNTPSSTTLQDVRLTLHTTGGAPRIAPRASWISPVLEAPTDVFAIDSITWDERVPAGTAITVSVRACRQASCADDPAWSGPVARGASATIARGRYLQLRVEMTSSGAADAELLSLTAMYRRSDAPSASSPATLP